MNIRWFITFLDGFTVATHWTAINLMSGGTACDVLAFFGATSK